MYALDKLKCQSVMYGFSVSFSELNRFAKVWSSREGQVGVHLK